jgi:hypothetical protein
MVAIPGTAREGRREIQTKPPELVQKGRNPAVHQVNGAIPAGSLDCDERGAV